VKRTPVITAALAIVAVAGIGWNRYAASGGDAVTPARAPAASGIATRNDAARAAQPAPVPPPDTPVRDVVAQLRPFAERGSPAAACRIVLEMSRCEEVAVAMRLASSLEPKKPTPQMLDAISRSLAEVEAGAHACEGVPRIDEATLYRYQTVVASHGGIAQERWLVGMPVLDPNDFLSNLDAWRDYRVRALRYVDRAIARRDRADLPLLLQLHSPNRFRSRYGIAVVNDVPMFLALYDAAELNDASLVPRLRLAARELREELSPAERERYLALKARIAVKWNDNGNDGSYAGGITPSGGPYSGPCKGL